MEVLPYDGRRAALCFGVASVCRRPPRYVPYKGTYVPYDGTYGAPDQGQTLDVQGRHPDDVNPKVKIHRFTISSDRYTESIFCSHRKNLDSIRYKT